jgi:hypothetical protein
MAYSQGQIYMNCKSSFIGTDSFIKWSTVYFLKNEASAKVLILDGHRAHCNSPLLLQTVVKITFILFIYGFTLLIPYTLQIRAFLWPFKTYFKYEAVALKITRYRVALLIWFAWSNVASVRVGVSVCKSTARVPKYEWLVGSSPRQRAGTQRPVCQVVFDEAQDHSVGTSTVLT